MISRPSAPRVDQNPVASAGIIAALVVGGLALKGTALMLFTNVLSGFVDVLEPVGFLPSVGLLVLWGIISASVNMGE